MFLFVLVKVLINNYLSNWESRYDDDGSTGYCYSNTCPAYHWHSPDWFVGQPWHYPASPHEGNAYIGMADYEIAEQKLTGNNKLEEDYHYLVKLYIYIHNTDVDGSPHPNPTNSVLNIYLAKNKI